MKHYLLILLIISVVTLTLGQDPVQFQSIDPSSLLFNSDGQASTLLTSSAVDPIWFGSGVGILPDGNKVVVSGFDARTNRQFFVTFQETLNTNEEYIYVQEGHVAYGDVMDTVFANGELGDNIQTIDNINVPLCFSSDMTWIALGYKLNGTQSSGSVGIYKRISMDRTNGLGFASGYRLTSRIYTDTPPYQSYFPYSVFCTRNFTTIYVSETSSTEAENPFIRLYVYSHTTVVQQAPNGGSTSTQLSGTFTLNYTRTFWNGTDTEAAPIALTSDGGNYAIRGSDPNFIYIYDATTRGLFSIIDITPLGINVDRILLTRAGRRTILIDSKCLSYDGCIIVLDYYDNIFAYNVSAAQVLTSSEITGSDNRLGFSVAVAGGNESIYYNAGIIAGLPGHSTQQGAALGWRPLLVNASNPTGPVTWTSSPSLMKAFGAGIDSTYMRTGATSGSFYTITDDQLVAIVGSIGNGTQESPGRALIFKIPLPAIPPGPPTVPPPEEEPTEPPQQDLTPIIDETEKITIATYVIGGIVLVIIFFISLYVIIKKCTKKGGENGHNKKYRRERKKNEDL